MLKIWVLGLNAWAEVATTIKRELSSSVPTHDRENGNPKWKDTAKFRVIQGEKFKGMRWIEALNIDDWERQKSMEVLWRHENMALPEKENNLERETKNTREKTKPNKGYLRIRKGAWKIQQNQTCHVCVCRAIAEYVEAVGEENIILMINSDNFSLTYIFLEKEKYM